MTLTSEKRRDPRGLKDWRRTNWKLERCPEWRTYRPHRPCPLCDGKLQHKARRAALDAREQMGDRHEG